MKKLQYNVILYDVNKRKFIPYDVLPYFGDRYKELTKKKEKRPITFDEFKEFITSEGKYRFWSRCEYEIILQSWPNQDVDKKIDAWDQIEMNIDMVTRTFMEYVKVS
jgi:hypothetical protein